MPLTNEQYGILTRTYSLIQQKNRMLEEERYQEVISKIPEYQKLEQQISENALNHVRNAIQNKGYRPEGKLSELNLDLTIKKQELLTSHGFPADYLAPIYSCPRCKDTGFLSEPHAAPLKKCECYQKLAAKIMFEQIQTGQIPATDSFENFNLSYYNDEQMDEALGITSRENVCKILEIAKKFALDFPKENGENLFIYGDAGVGKTFLTHCIINELKKCGRRLLYLTSHELFHIAGKGVFSHSGETNSFREQYEEMLTCELLIIDDLGSELINNFTLSQLYHFINERQLKGLSTIISTNLLLDHVKETYGERIFSRIVGHYTILRMFGDDLRIKKRFLTES